MRKVRSIADTLRIDYIVKATDASLKKDIDAAIKRDKTVGYLIISIFHILFKEKSFMNQEEHQK